MEGLSRGYRDADAEPRELVCQHGGARQTPGARAPAAASAEPQPPPREILPTGEPGAAPEQSAPAGPTERLPTGAPGAAPEQSAPPAIAAAPLSGDERAELEQLRAERASRQAAADS